MTRHEEELAAEARVGERVRALRLARGWTITHLAEQAQMHFNRVSRIERGERGVSLSAAVLLARALGVKLEVLAEAL